jgi:hypothetical protein
LLAGRCLGHLASCLNFIICWRISRSREVLCRIVFSAYVHPVELIAVLCNCLQQWSSNKYI